MHLHEIFIIVVDETLHRLLPLEFDSGWLDYDNLGR